MTRTVLVPDIFQRLVEIHGVDVAHLHGELEGKIRTRTWPGSDAGRAELQTLPDDFPRFKGVVVADVLRIQGMRLPGEVVFSTGSAFARIDMPPPVLPETVISALAGRRLEELLGHPAIGPAPVISAASRTLDARGAAVLRLDLDMPLRRLTQGRPPTRTTEREIPDLDALTALTHERTGAPPVDDAVATDPRLWSGLLPPWRIFGLRSERSAHDESPVVALRFPYDRKTVAAVARAGCGAWFDRDTYSWRILPTGDSLTALSRLLAEMADIVITPDGALHIRRTEHT
jgi:hypothetical protein